MRTFRGTLVPSAVLAVLLAVPAHDGSAQAPAAPASPATRPSKSVRGKLERVDATLNSVIMRSDEGGRLAWKFDPPVIAELGKFKVGEPMIVIYRQIAANEKRVTAVAFPGTAEKPTYLNMTGARVTMRSTAFVNGVCAAAPIDQSVTETAVPAGGSAEALEACWCCAADGETCTPGNRTGNGKAVLVSCFK